MSVKEYREADADGRIPLSSREYQAIRALYGSINSVNENYTQLERRCRGYKNGWRDLRLLVVMTEKVLRDVLRTVPVSKLQAMQKELDNTYVEVKTRGIVGKKDEGYMYVSEKTMIDLVKAAININCFGCEKTHKEAKKTCHLYQDIQSVFCYEFEPCEQCPFAEV